MKKLVFKIQATALVTMGCIIFSGLLCTTVAFGSGPIRQAAPQQQAQSEEAAQEFTKTIKKEFPISTTGTVDLSNKYGKVDVHTWDRDRVKVDVIIVVDARSESSAQAVFDRINIEFDNDDNFVSAQTTIEETKGWFDWGNSRSEFQVNYDVFMPASCNLQLSNKYGNSNVEAISGNAKVTVKYGDFQLEGVGGELTIALGYGNGTVVKARDVLAEVSYSKLNLNEVQDVDFDTKYSKLYIDKGGMVKAGQSRYDHFGLTKIDKFKIESRYGNVEIGEVESVIANSNYTDYRIDHLGDRGDFSLQYGGLRVDELAKGFSEVNLEGKYSDFKIYVEEGASFTLDAEADYATTTYPASMTVSYEKDKGTSHAVKGHAGTEGARSIIRANLKYGGLRVKQ
jgi:hypothetical protein